MPFPSDPPSSREVELWRSLPPSLRSRILVRSGPVWTSYGAEDRGRYWQPSASYGTSLVSSVSLPISGEALAMSSGLFSSIQVRIDSDYRMPRGRAVHARGYRAPDPDSEILASDVYASTVREACLLMVEEALSAEVSRRPPGSPLDRLLCALCATELSGATPLFCPFCQESGEALEGTTLRRFLEGESLPVSRIDDRASRLAGLVCAAVMERPDEVSSILVGE